MEGWLKAVNAKTGDVLWKFKTPSGIIGNPMTYVGPDGKQYVAMLSGIGGWSGIGVAAEHRPREIRRRPRRHRRLRRRGQLQHPGRRADGVLASVGRRGRHRSRSSLSSSAWRCRADLLLARAHGRAAWRRRQTQQFRVCADPENLPLSNQKLEGFENKIADAPRQGTRRDADATSGGDSGAASSGTR